MSNINKQALREAAKKATQGEWWSDVVETDGEYGDGEDRVSGYHSYAVYFGSESLLDMTNSTAACIHEEWDRDYRMAWDETGKRNAEFIAAASPATVLALLDELEAKDAQIANLTAERDALREGEMGDAKHSNTRSAADIYFQLVEECEIPAGGSLVEYVDDMRDRLSNSEQQIAELLAAGIITKVGE